jgi:hypothetical protein
MQFLIWFKFQLKSQLTSHLSPTEIQEIVSSQSQKAREIPPMRMITKSAEKPNEAPTTSSTYAAVVNNADNLRFASTLD